MNSNKVSIISACLLFLVLLLQVSVRVVLTERAYKLEEVRASILSSDELLREARLELARVYDPVFIKQQAKERLGMEATPPQRIRRISLEGML